MRRAQPRNSRFQGTSCTHSTAADARAHNGINVIAAVQPDRPAECRTLRLCAITAATRLRTTRRPNGSHGCEPSCPKRRPLSVNAPTAAVRGLELSPEALLRPFGDHLVMISRRAKALVRVAEAAGFEPARGLTLNPLSRSADPCSPQASNVHDLRQHLIDSLSEHCRTGVNETETETTPVLAAQPAVTSMTSRPPRLLSA